MELDLRCDDSIDDRSAASCKFTSAFPLLDDANWCVRYHGAQYTRHDLHC